MASERTEEVSESDDCEYRHHQSPSLDGMPWLTYCQMSIGSPRRNTVPVPITSRRPPNLQKVRPSQIRLDSSCRTREGRVPKPEANGARAPWAIRAGEVDNPGVTLPEPEQNLLPLRPFDRPYPLPDLWKRSLTSRSRLNILLGRLQGCVNRKKRRWPVWRCREVDRPPSPRRSSSIDRADQRILYLYLHDVLAGVSWINSRVVRIKRFASMTSARPLARFSIKRERRVFCYRELWLDDSTSTTGREMVDPCVPAE